jgi:flagellar motor switch protein FliN/FliY
MAERSLSQEETDAAPPADAGSVEDSPQADADPGAGQDEATSVMSEAQAAPPVDQPVDSAGEPSNEAAAGTEEERGSTDAAESAGETLRLPDFAKGDEEADLAQKIDLLNNVSLRVKIELGRTRMLVEDVLKLGEGSVVELNKLAGDPVEILANDRLIARGEVLVLNDNFCVRVSEVVSNEPRVATQG